MNYSPPFSFAILIACFLVLGLTIYIFTSALRRPRKKKIEEHNRMREVEIAQLIANDYKH